MKNLNLLLILFGALFFNACEDQNLQYRNDIDISNFYGSWIENSPQIITNDQITDTLFFNYGSIVFKEDGSYLLDSTVFWIGFYDGKWTYDANTNTLEFQQNFPKEIDGIPIIGAEDWNVNRSWEIVSIDNTQMKVTEHQLRESKVVLNPITQQNDLIQGIDLYFVRNFERLE